MKDPGIREGEVEDLQASSGTSSAVSLEGKKISSFLFSFTEFPEPCWLFFI
jgi:hypothetical protein